MDHALGAVCAAAKLVIGLSSHKYAAGDIVGVRGGVKVDVGSLEGETDADSTGVAAEVDGVICLEEG